MSMREHRLEQSWRRTQAMVHTWKCIKIQATEAICLWRYEQKKAWALLKENRRAVKDLRKRSKKMKLPPLKNP